MPFGLCNASATFQRPLDIILREIPCQPCLMYLHDVIVLSRTTDEHLRYVDEIITVPRRAGISLKLTNCTFLQPKVAYLGHLNTPEKLAVAKENTK